MNTPNHLSSTNTPRLRAVGFGAGGHAKVLIDAIKLQGAVDIVGLLDKSPASCPSAVLGVPVLGGEDLLPALLAQGINAFFVGVGSVGDARIRRKLYADGTQNGLTPIRIAHPSSIVSPSAAIGPGTVVLAGAIINPDAVVGANVIVNTGAIVEHDCRIGDHVHVATGARLAGGVTIDDLAHIGAGATIRQGIRVGRGAVVGAGAVVVKDVPDWTVVAGCPAQPLKTVEPFL